MTFPINHILFPTDFSDNATHALPFAAEIATKTGAKITICHIKKINVDLAPGLEKREAPADNEISHRLDNLISELKSNDCYRDISITTGVKEGQPVSSLLKQVADQDIDLIVMGTKGATADRNVIWGSVTSGIVKKSPIPVLAIPKDSNLENFRNIIFTTNYKEGDPSALKQTVSFARLFDSSISVLHVSDQKNLESEIRFRGFRELIKKYINFEKLTFHHQYDLDFFPTVAEYVLDNPTSMLVMIRYKKSFWEKLGRRNHSREMAFYSKAPLLVFPGEQNEKVNSIFDDSGQKEN